jgi:hypothetical protein
MAQSHRCGPPDWAEQHGVTLEFIRPGNEKQKSRHRLEEGSFFQQALQSQRKRGTRRWPAVGHLREEQNQQGQHETNALPMELEELR